MIKKSKWTSRTKQPIRRAWLRFAHEHGLIINPQYDKYVDTYLDANKTCPCDADRPSCPCNEVLEEIRKDGHCKCRLFWRDYSVYMEINVPEIKEA
jgi:ferredoxin-thioredoxin reductase catalytic subunit